MSNALQRVLSAIVLICILIVFFFIGQNSFSFLFCIVGLLVNEEILVNFLKKRRSLMYWTLQTVFTILYFLLFYKGKFLITGITSIAVFINILGLIFLFTDKFNDKFKNFLVKHSYVVPFLVLTSLTSVSSLLQYENWGLVFIYLLLINFSMDTGAWFIGVNFGKHKLWPKISPKKTREGTVGGIIITALFASLYCHFFDQKDNFAILVGFSIPFAIISQFGDLFQSKIKRIFELKDSSSLIPGHGGVYDRIDSLIFLGPFYVLLLTVFDFFK